MLGAVGEFLPGRRGALLRKVLDPEYLLAANATFPPAEVRRMGVDGDDPLSRRRPLWPESSPDLDGLFVYDQRTYLPPLLQRQDRISMAAGLEAREPFLDHLLVEWANALPASAKIPGGRRKHLLKAIAKPWLPDEMSSGGRSGSRCRSANGSALAGTSRPGSTNSPPTGRSFTGSFNDRRSNA